jgi:hypothetical protein
VAAAEAPVAQLESTTSTTETPKAPMETVPANADASGG